MNILFLSSVFPDADHPSRGTYNLETCLALTKKHSVQVVSPRLWADVLRTRLRGRSVSASDRTLSAELRVRFPTFWYPPKVLREKYGELMSWSAHGAVERWAAEFRPDAILGYLIGHPCFVDRRQLAECSPTFLVGAHGRTHRLLGTLSNGDVLEELTSSKAALEDVLSREVTLLAFPGGSYDERVVRIALEAGYRFLFTSDIRVNTPASCGPCIGRVPIKSTTDDATIERYVAGNLRPERLRELGIGTIKRMLGQRGYAALRSRVLSERSDQLDMADFNRHGSPTGQSP